VLDEHVEGETRHPLIAGAQTAEKQHAGLLKMDAQPRLG
jgi:hypothetical protein